MEVPNAHPYKGTQTTMVVLSVVFTFFGTVALVLRILGRFVVIRRLGADDWFMIGGMLLTGGYLFEILYGLRFGIGLHGKDVAVENISSILTIIWAIQLTYNTIIALVKLSIVCFYLRLATVDSALRKRSWATICFLILFYVTTQIATTLQCLPIRSNWDISGTIHKKCIDTVVYFYVLAAINIVLDIWILALPIRTLMNIKRESRDKIVLFVIFGVGAFSCISSIIRLYTIRVFAASKDPFYDGVPINIWSMIEINVAVICASVPAMKPLFTKTIRDRLNSSRNNRSGFNSYGNSHHMIPLSGTDTKNNSGKLHGTKNGYSVNATSNGMMNGSEEHINSKAGGIEYEREFTVEETYIGPTGKEGSPRVL